MLGAVPAAKVTAVALRYPLSQEARPLPQTPLSTRAHVKAQVAFKGLVASKDFSVITWLY